jgi:hypothetical protein
MTLKSAHFRPTENDIVTLDARLPEVAIRCSVDMHATRCSLCNHERKKLIRASVDSGNWYYSFCSVCIRAMHRRLP